MQSKANDLTGKIAFAINSLKAITPLIEFGVFRCDNRFNLCWAQFIVACSISTRQRLTRVQHSNNNKSEWKTYTNSVKRVVEVSVWTYIHVYVRVLLWRGKQGAYVRSSSHKRLWTLKSNAKPLSSHLHEIVLLITLQL